MNYPPPQQRPPDDVEAMARAMKRANRTPIFVVLAIVGAIVVGGGMWVLRSFVSARGELEEQGYANAKVTFHGPFAFGFTGTKGTSTCSGTMTRYPGSSSIEETCFDSSPPPPVTKSPPPMSNRQQLEASLERKFGKFGFDKFTCPEIADADATATCTLASASGVSMPAKVERTKSDTDGSWATWTTTLASTVTNADTLSSGLTKSVMASAKGKRHTGITVDCGKGPVIVDDGHETSCDLSTEDAKPLHAKVNVQFKKDGDYTWAVRGL